MSTKQFEHAKAPAADIPRQVASDAGPSLPPGRVRRDRRSVMVNVKMDEAAAIALAKRAKAEGITQKQFICRALEAAGVPMDPRDLEDRTPRRRAA
jgi:hypothetical protein